MANTEKAEQSSKSTAIDKNNSGANDDWEAIKLLLDENPSLKQRVLHKIKEIQRAQKEASSPSSVSIKDQRDFRLKEKQQQKK